MDGILGELRSEAPYSSGRIAKIRLSKSRVSFVNYHIYSPILACGRHFPKVFGREPETHERLVENCTNLSGIVFAVHGLNGTGSFVRPLVPHLNVDRLAVVSLDLPGHGLSPYGPYGGRTCLDVGLHLTSVEAVLKVEGIISERMEGKVDTGLARFKRGAGVPPLFLMGFSMGGYVAINIFIASPSLWDRVVLMSPAGLLPPKRKQGLLKAVQRLCLTRKARTRTRTNGTLVTSEPTAAISSFTYPFIRGLVAAAIVLGRPFYDRENVTGHADVSMNDAFVGDEAPFSLDLLTSSGRDLHAVLQSERPKVPSRGMWKKIASRNALTILHILLAIDLLHSEGSELTYIRFRKLIAATNVKTRATNTGKGNAYQKRMTKRYGPLYGREYNETSDDQIEKSQRRRMNLATTGEPPSSGRCFLEGIGLTLNSSTGRYDTSDLSEGHGSSTTICEGESTSTSSEDEEVGMEGSGPGSLSPCARPPPLISMGSVDQLMGLSRALSVPVLFLWGEDDEVNPWYVAGITVRDLFGHAWVRTYPGHGHIFFKEEDVLGVRDTAVDIRAFLNAKMFYKTVRPEKREAYRKIDVKATKMGHNSPIRLVRDPDVQLKLAKQVYDKDVELYNTYFHYEKGIGAAECQKLSRHSTKKRNDMFRKVIDRPSSFCIHLQSVVKFSGSTRFFNENHDPGTEFRAN